MNLSISRLLVFTLCLFAVSVEAGERPYWVDPSYVPSTQEPNEFVGRSQLWLSIKESSRQNALDEACEHALANVAKFFELSVETENRASQTVAGQEFSGRYSREIETRSKVKLRGIVPLDTYVEVVKEGLYIRALCLYSLNGSQIKRIEDARRVDQEKIDQLVNDVLNLVDIDNFDQASLLVTRLRIDHDVAEEFVTSLQQLIDDRRISAIDLSIVLSDSVFKPGSPLALSLVSNIDSYVYVFAVVGDSVSMVFPSPLDSYNVLQRDQVKQIPTPAQIRSSGSVKVDIGLEKLVILNSHSPIAINFVSKSFRQFNVVDKAAFKQTVDLCEHSKKCLVNKTAIQVDTSTNKKPLNSIELMINGETSKFGVLRVSEFLEGSGFSVVAGKGPKLKISISESEVYSEMIKSQIKKVSVDWSLHYRDSDEIRWSTKKTLSAKLDREQVLEHVLKSGRRALDKKYDK